MSLVVLLLSLGQIKTSGAWKSHHKKKNNRGDDSWWAGEMKVLTVAVVVLPLQHHRGWSWIQLVWSGRVVLNLQSAIKTQNPDSCIRQCGLIVGQFWTKKASVELLLVSWCRLHYFFTFDFTWFYLLCSYFVIFVTEASLCFQSMIQSRKAGLAHTLATRSSLNDEELVSVHKHASLTHPKPPPASLLHHHVIQWNV